MALPEGHDAAFYRAEAEKWRQKFTDANDVLNSTKADLDEFQISSKELEEELERELDANEKVRRDLEERVQTLENDKQEWMAKFHSLQNNYNTTTASLQAEVNLLREKSETFKRLHVELEMGNDDLERSERAVKSSLEDLESRFHRTAEDKILIEQELQIKVEECQRLKDEIRDLTSEVAVLKKPARGPIPPRPPLKEISSTNTSDLTEADLLPLSASVLSTSTQSTIRARAPITPSPSLQPSSDLWKSGSRIPPSPSRLPMSTSQLYSVAPPATPPHQSSRLPVTPRPPTVNPPKSRGIGMVNDMRNRTRAIQAKIGSGLPRLRLNSLRGLQQAAPETKAVTASPDHADAPGWVLVDESVTPKVVRPATSRASTDSDRSTRSGPPPSAFRVPALPSSSTSYADTTVLSPVPFTPRTPSRLSLSSSTNTHYSSHGSISSASTARSSSRLSTPSTSRPPTPNSSMIPTPNRYGPGITRSTGLGRRYSLGPSPPVTHFPRPPSADNASPITDEFGTLNTSRTSRPHSLTSAAHYWTNKSIGKVAWPSGDTAEKKEARRRKSSMPRGITPT